jgi:Pectate lyase superfamily protein
MKFILSAIFSFLVFVAPSQTYIEKDIKSFGARGNGKTNDQAAFQKAADYFNQRGGNGKLIIPKGTYIIGKQVFTGGKKNKPAYEGQDVLHFINIKNFSISGKAGSILKYARGLRIGAFSPATGKVYDHGNNMFVNRAYAATIGNCILIENSFNISVSGVTIDGNNGHLILGGIYGDVGRQIPHYGIKIINSKNIHIDNAYVHHSGLDGICVSNKETNSPDSISITNSSFEYNSRQGLSWVGGNQLYVKNCKFNHTGKGKFSSSPGAGVDIEAESGPIRNGVFEGCEFIDNNGCGLVADSGDSGDCVFTDCTFWGTTNWSAWIRKPGFTFSNCNFYGSVVHGYDSPNNKDATKFYDCHFEDKLYNGNPPYGKYLVESNNAKRMSFSNCTFITNSKKLCWFSSPGTYTVEEKYQLNNCKFIINNNNLPQNDFVGITRGVVAKNCIFNFTNVNAKGKKYNFGDTNPATNIGSSGTRILYEGK